jgi:hypothetical protein
MILAHVVPHLLQKLDDLFEIFSLMVCWRSRNVSSQQNALVDSKILDVTVLKKYLVNISNQGSALLGDITQLLVSLEFLEGQQRMLNDLLRVNRIIAGSSFFSSSSSYFASLYSLPTLTIRRYHHVPN